MMINHLIRHKDMVDLGYMFLNHEDESEHLRKINDEFAKRVGLEAVKLVKEKKSDDSSEVSLEEIENYLRENPSEINYMVIRIREAYLQELSKIRKNILIRG